MSLLVGDRYAAIDALDSGKWLLFMLLLLLLLCLLELGELANLTVIGSPEPSGMRPLSCLMDRSASCRWSNRTNPTPFDRPEHDSEQLSVTPQLF